VNQDIGFIIILDLAYGTQLFILAEALSIQDRTFKMIPNVQQHFHLKAIWIRV
jgi:hypothetical protein